MVPHRAGLVEQPLGENVLITWRSMVQEEGTASTTMTRAHVKVPARCQSAVPGLVTSFTHKFSPGSQGTLYPVKLFGIISLFERCRELSTAACPLYDECGDMIA